MLKQRLEAWKHLWLLSVLFVGLLGCQPPKEEAEEKTPEVEETLVETVTLEATDFDEQDSLTGVTEPLKAANVTPEIPGRILKLDLVEGSPVEKGIVAVKVSTATSKARIDSIKVQLEQIKRDIERTEKLIDKGLATKTTLEQLTSQRDVLKKSIKEVRVAASQAETKTPIGGIVTETYAEVGEYASPGMPLARIVDIDTIIVKVGLPERDILYVKEGGEVQVRIEALNKDYIGTIKRVGIEVDGRSRTFPVEIQIANPDHHIRAGMRATVTLVKQSLKKVVVIPRDSIMQGLEGAEVMTVSEGKAKTMKIETGPSLSNFVVVEGLQSGTALVVRGHRNLVDGEPLKVSADEACCSAQLQRYIQGSRQVSGSTGVVPEGMAQGQEGSNVSH